MASAPDAVNPIFASPQGMPLKFLEKRRLARSAARALYERAVSQARHPAFYASLAVPDTLDGRFDMVALHVFLLLHRLRGEGEGGARLAQALFDTMFEDMDDSLRELGVGDLGVGRRVKVMARAMYGRIAAYQAGLEAGASALEDALARNLYRNAPVGAGPLAALGRYLRREAAALAAAPAAALLAGEMAFGPPPAMSDLVESRPGA
jgi:cytochrome b pre-mRNA-processing protein 3